MHVLPMCLDSNGEQRIFVWTRFCEEGGLLCDGIVCRGGVFLSRRGLVEIGILLTIVSQSLGNIRIGISQENTIDKTTVFKEYKTFTFQVIC